MIKAIISRLGQMYLSRTPSEAEREAWERARAKIRKIKLIYSLLKRGLNFLSFLDSSILTYWYAVIRSRPYFGGYLAARQNELLRLRLLLEYVENRLKNGEDIKILEVGSWAGQSTIMLAALCKRYGTGKVFCIDTWKGTANRPPSEERASKDKVLKLFLRNIRAAEVGDYIVPMRGKSEYFYDLLKDGSFDVVYIDGDHSYQGFKKDLLGLPRKVREGGLLCGDDLDLKASEIDMAHAEANKEKDYIQDSRTRRYYHPGITLAVHEILGEVEAQNGFWGVLKKNGKWQKLV